MRRISFKFFNPGGHCTCVLWRSVIAANRRTAVSGGVCTPSESCPTPHEWGKVWSSAPYCVCQRDSLQVIAPIKAVLQSRTAVFWVITQYFLETLRDNMSFPSSGVKNPVNGLLSALKFVHKMSAYIIKYLITYPCFYKWFMLLSPWRRSR
jgi:hypothetical protein